MVYHAARRRHALDTEYEGLVFGRLDLGTGATHYVGRMGIRDESSHPLVVDWRAPAAAPLYPAPPAQPLGAGRRRMIQSSRGRGTGIRDDPLGPAAGRLGVVGRGMTQSGGAGVPGIEGALREPGAAPETMGGVGAGARRASLSKAPGRGMRDIVATIQREQDEAIRSPASGVTIVT